MRTPKIEALHRAINWFNESYNYNIDCLSLDQSPIDSNAWLAGFTDGDYFGFSREAAQSFEVCVGGLASEVRVDANTGARRSCISVESV